MIPKVSCNLDSVIFLGESFTHMIKKWKAEPPFLPACISHKLFIFFFFFGLFIATLAAYGGSQAKGPIAAAAASLCHSHRNLGFEPHLRRPDLYPTERGQGLNLHHHGHQSDSFLLSYGRNSTSSYLFFLFCLFRAAPTAYGGSQARGSIGAVAASLCQSHSNSVSEPCLRPAPQLIAMPDP